MVRIIIHSQDFIKGYYMTKYLMWKHAIGYGGAGHFWLIRGYMQTLITSWGGGMTFYTIWDDSIQSQRSGGGEGHKQINITSVSCVRPKQNI